MSSDGADVTSGGRLFQTWGPATGKAPSPTADRPDKHDLVYYGFLYVASFAACKAEQSPREFILALARCVCTFTYDIGLRVSVYV